MDRKIVVITGGTKGLGRAFCEVFAAEGFDLITCARDEVALRSLSIDLEAAHGITCLTLAVDLSIKDAARAFGYFALGFGRPDVVINNVGLFGMGDLADEPDGYFERMMDTNLGSAYHLTRSLLPAMIEARSGHIFNICSVASMTARQGGGSYFTSKYALLGFSKGLREDLKEHGIKVTAVLPSATLTGSWEGMDVDPERLMSPGDVAHAVWSAYQMSSRSVVEELLIRPQMGDY